MSYGHWYLNVGVWWKVLVQCMWMFNRECWCLMENIWVWWIIIILVFGGDHCYLRGNILWSLVSKCWCLTEGIYVWVFNRKCWCLMENIWFWWIMLVFGGDHWYLIENVLCSLVSKCWGLMEGVGMWIKNVGICWGMLLFDRTLVENDGVYW